jgi:uncharacterized protein (UPF0335 family)
MDNEAYGVTASEIRTFVERWERLEAERKDFAEAQKEVMAEAKGRGYDVKVLREIIKLRQSDAQTLAEFEAILELYKTAMGI